MARETETVRVHPLRDGGGVIVCRAGEGAAAYAERATPPLLAAEAFAQVAGEPPRVAFRTMLPARRRKGAARG